MWNYSRDGWFDHAFRGGRRAVLSSAAESGVGVRGYLAASRLVLATSGHGASVGIALTPRGNERLSHAPHAGLDLSDAGVRPPSHGVIC
jgi:hypothetical protein